MGKIKIREKVKNIKVLDKAAIAGRRMKNAAIRAKEQTARVGNDRQESLGEYAGEQVETAANASVRRIAGTAVRGTKFTARKGKQIFRERRSKPDMERTENTSLDMDPEPLSDASAPRAAARPLAKTDVRTTRPTPVRHSETPPTTVQDLPEPSFYKAENHEIAVERGRALAKREAAQRTVSVKNQTAPAIKTREHAQVSPPVQPSNSPARERRRTMKTVRRRDKTALRPASTPIRTQALQPGQKTVPRPFLPEQRHAAVVRSRAQTAAKSAKAAGEAVKKTVRAAAAAAQRLTAMLAASGGVILLILVMILLPGLLLGSCFGIFFSGHDSGTGQTMPAVIREINQEFEDRIEAIQNETPHDDVEISASQARWPEVLAVYAVKTTTDPTNAQEVATVTAEKKTLLKEIFWTMHEISSYTTSSSHTVTSTVPTEGGGTEQVTDTVTTTTLHISITHRSVDEMANEYGFSTDQRQQLHELLSEENRRLWTALLSGLGDGDDTIVAVALSQLGNRGGEPYWSWYGFTNRVEWCACFVSWCADQCGYLEADAFPKFSYCPAGVKWFQDAGLWQDRTFEPRPGDIAFFDWANDGVSDHVGIVEKVENGWIFTIEGNCDDACKQLAYPIGDSCIYGFGTLNYE